MAGLANLIIRFVLRAPRGQFGLDLVGSLSHILLPRAALILYNLGRRCLSNIGTRLLYIREEIEAAHQLWYMPRSEVVIDWSL